MKGLIILGAGGHGRVVSETASATGRFSRIAFLDDRYEEKSEIEEVAGNPVLGPLSRALDMSGLSYFDAASVAIGDATKRMLWIQRLGDMGYSIPPLVHPTAWVSPSAHIASGTVILAHATMQSHSKIGLGGILNTGCSVDHDSKIAEGVHICPGARLGGEVAVGSCTWIGIGASVIQGIHIGSNVIVGAGAAVVCDLPDGVTAKGVPARYSVTRKY